MKRLISVLCILFLHAGTGRAWAQVPALSSYPSAEAVLFLDFDGHTVNGTVWNWDGPIHCGPSGMTNEQVTDIFRRVAEDFRPFDLNVTTDSTRYWKAPADRRMRVVITVTSEWYGRAGGVAYNGSFTFGDNTPCFVFSALLGYQVKKIAEASSHESGHTLGLRHQSAYDAFCGKTAEYNPGTGSGQTGWAPIMGLGYYKNFTGWHKGPNSSGCDVIQSDLEVITDGMNGFGYRADDYAETFASASSARLSSGAFRVEGMISTPDDRDMFRFVLNSRRKVSLSALPAAAGEGNAESNLDLALELYSSPGQKIGTYNPPHMLHAAVDTVLEAGTYYLSVDGTGNANVSDYGSLGSFIIEGQFTEVHPNPLQKLQLIGRADGDIHHLGWLIEAKEAVKKQVLQFSTNGSAFEHVSQPTNTARAFSYTSGQKGVVLYRLQVTLGDGRQYYSNTIALRSGLGTQRPQLLSNITAGQTLMVASPDAWSYAIHDVQGRTLGSGLLPEGSSSIGLQAMAPGIYFIRFTKEGSQFVEKFVKQ